MLVYQFKCKECGERAESDDRHVNIRCCRTSMIRVYGPVGVQFKGSGFYNTDYGDD